MATEYYFADQNSRDEVDGEREKQEALHLGNRAFLSHALFFLHLLLFVFPFASALNGSSLDQADSQALQVLKHELQDFKGVLAGWNGSDPSEACYGWVGIKCLQGRVVSIQLPWKGLGGKIAEKIGELKALRRISLHDNALAGSIPQSLGSLPKLRGVYLFNNRLSGSIPASIANCAHLQSLDLSNNSLSGLVLPLLASSPKLRRLNLSFNSLSGSIPVSITQSSSLVFLSLQHNNLSGAIPNRWASGGDRGPYLLQRLTLDHNRISGAVPDSLGQLGHLKDLDLSSNRLTGAIPATIGNISGITLLDLSENSLDGEIPQSLAALFNLTTFNVSHNNLSGAVPFPLGRRFNSSSFFGNRRLCGYSNSVPCPPPNLPAQSAEAGKHRHHRRHWLNTKDFVLILAGVVLVALLLVCCILLCCFLRKRAASRSAAAGGGEKAVPEATTEYGSGGEGKLVHFDGPSVFTADDLLCATAEVIGKSNYGTTYKATLEDGREVAVKRLREKMTKSQKEFEAEVAALGSIRHENLLPVRAFYVGPKGEKLLVFDYLPKGSLASNLHDRGTEIPITWPTRKSIAVGICRGLNHLHIQHSQVHGSLTSAGVLLDGHNRPKISDFGLPRLMASAAAAATAGSLGYRPPELSKAKKAATPKTDVFSLGVIMLELLTGKSAGEATYGMDLPEWVASVVKEEWTNEVFDLEIMKDGAGEGDELLNTLKLALHCVDPSPSARPDIQQILQQLEEMSHADSADDDEARQPEINE